MKKKNTQTQYRELVTEISSVITEILKDIFRRTPIIYSITEIPPYLQDSKISNFNESTLVDDKSTMINENTDVVEEPHKLSKEFLDEIRFLLAHRKSMD